MNKDDREVIAGAKLSLEDVKNELEGLREELEMKKDNMLDYFPDGNPTTEKLEEEIDSLDEHISTIESLQDKLFKLGSDLPVTLASGLFHEAKSFGYVKVLAIEFKRIKDVTITEILADIGRRTSTQPRVYFYKLMKDFYGHKRWWDGKYTVIQKLTVEKLGRKMYYAAS